jgi:hypothetical protein
MSGAARVLADLQSIDCDQARFCHSLSAQGNAQTVLGATQNVVGIIDSRNSVEISQRRVSLLPVSASLIVDIPVAAAVERAGRGNQVDF